MSWQLMCNIMWTDADELTTDMQLNINWRWWVDSWHSIDCELTWMSWKLMCNWMWADIDEKTADMQLNVNWRCWVDNWHAIYCELKLMSWQLTCYWMWGDVDKFSPESNWLWTDADEMTTDVQLNGNWIWWVDRWNPIKCEMTLMSLQLKLFWCWWMKDDTCEMWSVVWDYWMLNLVQGILICGGKLWNVNWCRWNVNWWGFYEISFA